MAVILVVEDEYGIASLLEDVLVDEGHRVILAANGRQALDRMGAERPDLVFTDYMMPVMDGVALLAAIATRPNLQGIPIVIMSSLPEAAIAERTSAYTLFLRKPFKIFSLLDVIAKLLPAQP